LSSRSRKIVLEIDEDTYKKIVNKAENEGFTTLTDYILMLIKREISYETVLNIDELYEKLKTRIQRFIEDEMSKYVQLINENRAKIAELYEAIDQLKNSVEDLKKRIEQPVSYKARQTGRKTGIERLREEKVVFESKLPSYIRRDQFFNYLEREGAVVLKLSKERIAVEPSFWSEFKKKLFEEINFDDEEKIKKILDNPGYELFRKLRDEALIYFDSKEKKWHPSSREHFNQ